MDRRLRRAIAVTTLIVPLALALTPAAAQAIPTSCTVGPDGTNGSYAVCTVGSGAYRAWIRCSSWGFPYRNYYINTGPWQVTSTHLLSKAKCNARHPRH